MSRIHSRPFTIVITGVTRGLGRAMVDEFARLGHTVCGCARTKKHLVELARIYPRHDFQPVDVASDADVNAWAAHLVEKHGAPDFVINNAAIISPKVSLWQIEDRIFSRAIDINIKGVVNVIRHFAPAMIRRKRGVIVNFSSRWGKRYEKNMAPYCASKWAVVALTHALAEELRPEGVAAIGLNPGIVKTQMLQRYLGSRSMRNMSGYPSPADWAKIAVPFILRLRLSHSGKMLAIVIPPSRRSRRHA
jgi:NAD(P)-dependent dehydrogenase (short-subunit alcohol dehydrogenase family)